MKYMYLSHNINKCILKRHIHTYRGGGVNNNTSLIDHFSMPSSIHTMILDYFKNESADNLSDHVPLFINFQCIVESVPNNPEPVMHSKPVWGLHNQIIYKSIKINLMNCCTTSFQQMKCS